MYKSYNKKPIKQKCDNCIHSMIKGSSLWCKIHKEPVYVEYKCKSDWAIRSVNV